MTRPPSTTTRRALLRAAFVDAPRRLIRALMPWRRRWATEAEALAQDVRGAMCAVGDAACRLAVVLSPRHDRWGPTIPGGEAAGAAPAAVGGGGINDRRMRPGDPNNPLHTRRKEDHL